MSKDMVNHPEHYIASNGLEVIDVIDAFTKELNGCEAVYTANVIKYICRWEHKNGLEDLKKAQWYLNRLIERLEERKAKDARASIKDFYLDKLKRFANLNGCLGVKDFNHILGIADGDIDGTKLGWPSTLEGMTMSVTEEGAYKLSMPAPDYWDDDDILDSIPKPVFLNECDAEYALADLNALIYRYDRASIKDFYNICAANRVTYIPPSYGNTNEYYGWDVDCEVFKCDIKKNKNGHYVIDLPHPIRIRYCV